MDIVWVYGLISVTLVSLVSLVGVVIFVVSDVLLKRWIFALVAMSAGALFGDVFIHLVPELFLDAAYPLPLSLSILGGIVLFFMLEKFLRWHHCHDMDEHEPAHSKAHIGQLNLISDAVHNLVDGLFIGISYTLSIPVGIATTVAVFLHEVPQEIGDFGIFLHAGFSKRKALFLNFISALFAVFGTLIALYWGNNLAGFSEVVLPLMIGMFIYIAGSDLVPELHKTTRLKTSLEQLFFLLIGILFMVALTFFD